jgi:putative endonuclease
MSVQEKIPCTYIMASGKNGTLYVGVTSNLISRVQQHKLNLNDGFTKQYNVHILVYYEVSETMETAIAREKQIKAGSRKKKLALIEKDNFEWRDLSEDL